MGRVQQGIGYLGNGPASIVRSQMRVVGQIDNLVRRYIDHCMYNVTPSPKDLPCRLPPCQGGLHRSQYNTDHTSQPRALRALRALLGGSHISRDFVFFIFLRPLPEGPSDPSRALPPRRSSLVRPSLRAHPASGEGVSPVEPSRRRSDGDPSSPVGWRALRSEGWKWEGSKTDLSRSGRVEGWRVEGWRGG